MAEEILGGDAAGLVRQSSSFAKGTRAILVRGAETSFLGKGVFPDKTDRAGLTENGLQQSQRVAQRLTRTHESGVRFEIGAVFTAPTQGEQQTAGFIVDGLRAKTSEMAVTTIDELKSAETGCWAGKTKDAVAKEFPEDFKKWQANPTTFAPEGGETGEGVADRVSKAIVKLLEEHKGKSVVIVMTGSALRLAMLRILGLDLKAFADQIEQLPSAVNVVDFNFEGESHSARLLTLNDVSHFTEITSHDPTKQSLAPTWQAFAFDEWDDDDLLDELRGAGGGGSSAFGDNDS